MDPSKNIGKIKEQVFMENMARRNYPKKWGKLVQPELNKFYNQDEINKELQQQLKLKDLCPFCYTGEGDSYFVSKDMYDALIAKCRCRRERTGCHILKCVQKEQYKNLFPIDESNAQNKTDNTGTNQIKLVDSAKQSMRKEENAKKCKSHNVPETSNALIGWQREKPRYNQWEKSMKYISPVLTMPGHRITAIPYNAIIIG